MLATHNLLGKIAHIKRGFVTNSSSSHHIVRVRKQDIPKIDARPSEDSCTFGWTDFVLKTPETKRRYVASCLYHSMEGLYEYKTIILRMARYDSVIKDGLILFVGSLFPLLEHSDIQKIAEGYVAHGGSLPFPTSGDIMDYTHLIDWLRDNIIDDDAAIIIGGNDNEEGINISKEYDTEFLEFPFFDNHCDPSTLHFRIDKEDGHITVFDKLRGNVHRLEASEGKRPKCSYTPEMVDMTITNYCPKNCKFCYRSSGTDGKHAPFADVRKIAYRLAGWGVFEVALGGGEPTTHPRFGDILSIFHKYNIVPNFSTGDTKWTVTNPDLVKVVADTCGAVALSTTDLDTIKWWANSEILMHMKVIHYVLGIEELDQLQLALQVCYDNFIPIVLLKPKTIGRGKEFAFKDYTGWKHIVDKCLKTHRCRWGNDIRIGNELSRDLIAENCTLFDPLYYEDSDGAFTMYLDAVSMKAGENSFVPADKMYDVKDFDINVWMDTWRKIKESKKVENTPWRTTILTRQEDASE